jgi:hypothetical protein
MNRRRSHRALAAGALAACAGAVVACGVRTPLNDEELVVVYVEAGAPASVGPSPKDASSPSKALDASDANEAPDVALPPTDLGNVLLTSGPSEDGGAQSFSASASFFPSVAATGCNIEALFGCTLETCVGTTDDVLVSAGTIEVAGGLYPLTLVQQGNGTYGPSDDAGAPLWQGGESLVIASSGGVVPSFTVRVVAPRQIDVDTMFPSSIARTTQFSVDWDGVSTGMVAVDLSVQGASKAYYLECQFDPQTTVHGVVPANALAALPAGSALLTVSTLQRTDVTAGSWTISTFVQTNGTSPYTGEYTGVVRLE